MDLFQVQRYWSDDDDDENAVPRESEHDPQHVLSTLNAKLAKKRKVEEEEAEIQVDEDAVVEEEEDKSLVEKTKKKKKTKAKKANQEESRPDDFMVLGDKSITRKKKIKRILPAWLANPDIVTVDFKEDQLAVEDLKGLDHELVACLKSNGITRFFPVQRQVIPKLLPSASDHFFRPCDVCVSAPTGSGKTLAFVLPLIHSLKHRVVPRIRALVILPVQELAAQVFQVFQTYSHGSGLSVKLLTSQKSFATEQNELVRAAAGGGWLSLADIIVTTPGRLVDHIQRTEGFCLEHLRFLVIDEADRVMEDIQNDWLTQVEDAVYAGGRARPGPLNVAAVQKRHLPLQKLLFSATLSQNPEQLQDLNLFEPKLYSTVVQPEDILSKGTDDNLTTEYTTPNELQEEYVMCQDPLQKPQLLRKVLKKRGWKKVIVFTKSIQNTHFLSVLLEQYGLSVGELSSKVSSNRKKLLNRFKSGDIEILVCTDALARGIDIGKVEAVVSYDCPKFTKTYIHRVGRTARAGATGTAMTIVDKKEVNQFHGMLSGSSKAKLKEVVFELDGKDASKFTKASKKAAKVLEEELAKERQKKGGNKRMKKTSKK